MPFDFGPIEVLTFDCYGTLVDWETGILTGLRAVIGARGSDDKLLEAYALAEESAEAGTYQRYRDILAASLRQVLDRQDAGVGAIRVRGVDTLERGATGKAPLILGKVRR